MSCSCALYVFLKFSRFRAKALLSASYEASKLLQRYEFSVK